jgi:hypothetical protein
VIIPGHVRDVFTIFLGSTRHPALRLVSNAASATNVGAGAGWAAFILASADLSSLTFAVQAPGGRPTKLAPANAFAPVAFDGRVLVIARDRVIERIELARSRAAP